MENTLINKNLYKIFITTIKYVPYVLAILKVIGLILNYFKIPTFFLTCLGGTSIIFIGMLYIISFIFKFCLMHRLSLHYVTILILLTTIDHYIGMPLAVEYLFKLYALLSGVFISSWIVVWFVNRKNPKIDHIKQLCESYAECCK